MVASRHSKFLVSGLQKTKFVDCRRVTPLHPLKQLKTLLLDDDRVDRDYFVSVSKRLDSFNLSIDQVSSADDASAAIQENDYDLLVVDFWLGKETSVGFISECIDKCPYVPIIMLTSLDTQSIRELGSKASATSFLPKLGLNVQQLDSALSELSTIH